MDDIIKSITVTDSLLEKTPLLGNRIAHPVKFPAIKMYSVKPNTAKEIIEPLLKGYEDRVFYVNYLNYGIDVCAVYKEGEFVSLALKGDGEVGEQIANYVVARILPTTANAKQTLVLHCTISVLDTEKFSFNFTKYDVEGFVKQRLLDGFEPYEDKNIVIRPTSIYVDGILSDIYDTWDLINNMTVTGYSEEHDFESLVQTIKPLCTKCNQYFLPQKGICIKDSAPHEPNAFPETHFLFDESEGLI